MYIDKKFYLVKVYNISFIDFFSKIEKEFNIITSVRSEWSSYWQSHVGRLNDIQTALKPEKIVKNVFLIILGLAEKF